MNAKDAAALSDAIVECVKRTVDGPRVSGRLHALEQRVAELEARPLQKWAGTHSEGTQYAEASLVTKRGSLWAATATTTSTPGTPGSDWRLIVKRGHA